MIEFLMKSSLFGRNGRITVRTMPVERFIDPDNAVVELCLDRQTPIIRNII